MQQNQATETILISLKDGLKEKGAEYSFSPSSYFCNYFCRVPGDWTQDHRLKDHCLEKIFETVYGNNWRVENEDGSQFVVEYFNTLILPPSMVKSIQWTMTKDDKRNHFWFYIASETGELRKAAAPEFQEEVDAFFGKQSTSLQPKNPAGWETFSALALDNPERLARFTQYFDSPYKGHYDNFTQYVYDLVEKHLAAAGLAKSHSPFDDILLDRKNWRDACWKITRGGLYDAVQQEEHHSLARGIFKELVDFCLLIPNDNAAQRIIHLLEIFVKDFQLPAEIEALLPNRAKTEMPAMKEGIARWEEAAKQAEEEDFRTGQMSY